VYFECLALEIYSTRAGWEVIKPPTCKGLSGVEHRFSFLASKKGHLFGFDLCTEVGDSEVLRTFIKEIDSCAAVLLVCLKGRPTDSSSKLAKDYGVRILSPADIGSFFDKELTLISTT
jgi:hypothetical protein